MSNSQFRFMVDPSEAEPIREARWDRVLTVLQASGFTVAGLGPDGDWPVFVEFPDGQTIDHTSSPLDGPFIEVYGTRRLPSAQGGKRIPADLVASLGYYSPDTQGRDGHE